MQQPYLIRGSAMDNVVLGMKIQGLRYRRKHVLSLLAELGFDADPYLSVEKLSGGQRQLIALARCLVLQPQVLLLDEPFCHLDEMTCRRIKKWLRQWVLDKGSTVVFSGHDSYQCMVLADEVVALASGRLVSAPLVNLFPGRCEQSMFVTACIQIRLPGLSHGSYAAVDPRDIVLSFEPLRSSMRNRFAGQVVGLVQIRECVRVSVKAGEQFEVLITRDACQEMGLTLGRSIWVNFKSTAVKIF